MATATKTKDEVQARCDKTKVKVNSVFSRHSHGVVQKFIEHPKHGRFARLKNSTGYEWDVAVDVLEQEFSFADQFDSTETVSTTKAIEILEENPMTAMTITYHKKVKEADVADVTQGGQSGQTQKQWIATVKAAMAGEERTMVGHHTGNFDVFKRLYFTEQVNSRSSKPETRLADLRTLRSVIVGRVKYTVK